MIKKFILCLFLVLLVRYLLLSEPPFPAQPLNSYKSIEPADTESVLRQSYYTNLSRPEIMDYYYAAMGNWGIRQVLPPEDAFAVIRDQTRSSYLEEIIHPFRESLYVNAYVPLKPSEQINIARVHYLNKVTIRYVPSSPVTRLTVLMGTILVSYWLVKAWRHA